MELLETREDDAGLIPVVPPAGPDAPRAEDVVSVPLAQLRQLVELLGEVVQEIKSTRQIPPDLEQGNTNVIRKHEVPNKCYSYCNFPHDQYSRKEEMKYRGKAVDKIWNSVQPWDLTRLSEIPEGSVRYIDLDNYWRQGNWIYEVFSYEHWSYEREFLLADKISGIYNSIFGLGESERLDIGHLLSGCVASIISSDKCLLGDILLGCYQSEILNRRTDSQTGYNHFENTVAIVAVLLISNERFSSNTSNFWNIRTICITKPLDIVLGMDIASLFQIMPLSSREQLALEGSKDSSFAADDLNIKSLKSIGGLSIEWTDSFEDHLQLNLVNKTLYIAWFLVGMGPRSAMGGF